MSNQSIRLKFTNAPLMRTQQRLLDIIKERFDVQLVDKNPDYVIGSAFTPFEILRYPHAIKILFTGENIVPDFNMYDYAIGFDHLTFGDRYLRLPLYCFYPDFESLTKGKNEPLDYTSLLNRKFCSFVVSNGIGAAPIRDEFFKELCKYKKVDSAGKHLNNMGGAYLKDKRSFISGYKFNIAFENSQVDGYTTEKIMEPMAVNSIPIYWGNPSVAKDFNIQSFINLGDYGSIKECIDFIVELDRNDELYLKMLHEPWFNTNHNYCDYKERIWNFFETIFSKPHDKARYLTDYGYQPYYRERLQQYRWMAPYEKPVRIYHKTKEKVKALLRIKQ